MNREFAKEEFARLSFELDFLTDDEARRRAEGIVQEAFGGESAGEVRARAAADYARLVEAREANRKLRKTLREITKGEQQ